MGIWRKVKRTVAKLTGVQTALERRLEAERQRHKAEIARLESAYEYQAKQARVQRRRAQGAEKLYRTNRRRANELAALVRVLDVVPRWEYGSLSEGRRDWSAKWHSTRALKILMFATRDYSGSFYKWASAINNHTEHAARLVVTAPHAYGYELDLIIPNPNLIASDWPDLWMQADVLHLKDETGFMNASNRLPPEMLTSFDGPKVFTQYGGYARKHKDDFEYREFLSGFDEVVSMTPDLCFEWLEPRPIYLPHSIDCDEFRFEWSDRPVIGHSPSTRARKGTEDFLESMGSLAKQFSIKLDLIEGVSHAEAVERKKHLGLFFDQAGREAGNLGTTSVIGWYGNSALEAAVYGVPTIAHLSEEALAGAERAGFAQVRHIPIVNTPLGKEGIQTTIRDLLKSSAEERSALAKRTREFIEDFHSQRVVGKALGALYQDVTR